MKRRYSPPRMEPPPCLPWSPPSPPLPSISVGTRLAAITPEATWKMGAQPRPSTTLPLTMGATMPPTGQARFITLKRVALFPGVALSETIAIRATMKKLKEALKTM